MMRMKEVQWMINQVDNHDEGEGSAMEESTRWMIMVKRCFQGRGYDVRNGNEFIAKL